MTHEGKRLGLLAIFLLALPAAPAKALVTWSVTFNDPTALYSPYYPLLESDVLAAGAAWSEYLQGDGTIDLRLNLDPTVPTADGASTTTVFVGNDGKTPVYEQGAAWKANTGQSTDAGRYDGYIDLGTGYLTQDLWLDPEPLVRTLAVPANKVDAVSLFEHEIGHILAFNGFRDPYTGALSSGYESTFDQNVVYDGQLYFIGRNATELYGGPVPLLPGTYGHVDSVGALQQDLMNGYSLSRGARYSISPLDRAIATDAGVALSSEPHRTAPAIPESSPGLLLAAGLTLLAVPVRRRRRRR